MGQNIKRIKIRNICKKILAILGSLLILLLGLDLIKHVLVSGFHKDFLSLFFVSPTKSFFISYLMTELTMSGSPIAGAFISLGETLAINTKNLAAILMGTRGGVNSFLLITGLLMLFKGKSLRRSLGITVIQFFVTLSVTLLASIFLFPILKIGRTEIIAKELAGSLAINGLIDTLIGFLSGIIKNNVAQTIPILIFGIICLGAGLFFFDKSFSFLKKKENKEILEKFENKKTAFISGFLITALTMSLSVSVTILLPLYIRKLINRRLLIAYILGANISTLFDTLFLGIMTKSTIGIHVILSFLLAVIIAVTIYSIGFKYYRKYIGKVTDIILKNKYRFLAFTIIVMAIPIIFLLK